MSEPRSNLSSSEGSTAAILARLTALVQRESDRYLSWAKEEAGNPYQAHAYRAQAHAIRMFGNRLSAVLAVLAQEPPTPQTPDDVPAWVQIRAGSELSELIRLVRFAPGQPTGFFHSQHDAEGLVWRWLLKWAKAAAGLSGTSTQEPEIDCPACGVTVKQVASATLSLALFQHWQWACAGKAWTSEPPPTPERSALIEIARLRLATDEGSLRVRADKMWEVATKAVLALPVMAPDTKETTTWQSGTSTQEPPNSFACKARQGLSDPPADCDWPTCGCDPYADKVIAALEESGKLSGTSEPPKEPTP